MTTFQFNCVGSGCGFLSTAGAGLTWQGHTYSGVIISVLAASVSIAACVSWFRGHMMRASRVRAEVVWRPQPRARRY